MNFHEKLSIETSYLNSLQTIGFIDKWTYVDENDPPTDICIEFNFHNGTEGFDHEGYGTIIYYSSASLLNDECLFKYLGKSTFIKAFLHQCREKQSILAEKQVFEKLLNEIQNKPKARKYL
ncbi:MULTISPECIES: hypothetical protein [Burkholderia]|uniref:hypothetical protein n=1 Tax=Burkholderia TaxID=32008 RepID=UPI00117EFCF6|nr:MULTISPECIES: hypothetical protein [Burkholderia]